MGYKTITLSDDAYNRLLERKIGNESFSDVVIRLTNDTTLRDFVGIIPEGLISELESNMKKFRKDRNQRFFTKLQEDWVESE